MQLGIEPQIPDGLLAANALLAENSRQGVPTSRHMLHPSFEFAISSTYKGFPFGCYEGAFDPVVAPSNGPQKPGIPYNVCVAGALYNELTSIKSYTDQANADLAKSYGVGAALLGPGAAIKYGMGSTTPFAAMNLAQSFLAGVAAKAYFITVPAFASGVSAAANQYKQDVKACGGG